MSLKQSSKESSNPRHAVAESERECRRRERDCTCLKVDTSTDETFVFPYQHLLSAQHTRTSGDETLKLSFGTHEVVIAGKRLGEIVAALQDLAVEEISAVPPRYRGLPQGEGPWVTAIEVRLVE
jgi:hypothetical protein